MPWISRSLMKPSRFLAGLVGGLALVAAYSSAASVSIESRIIAATVYPDRAVATRVGKVTLTAGTTEVLFDRLPSTLVGRPWWLSTSNPVATPPSVMAVE